MFKFIFHVFVAMSVLYCSSLVIVHFFPSSRATVFQVGEYPITWVLIGSVSLAFAAWRSLK